MTVKIIYMDKRTLEKHEVSFPNAVDQKHAMQIARKLRPKFHKIVSVSMSIVVDLRESKE